MRDATLAVLLALVVPAGAHAQTPFTAAGTALTAAGGTKVDTTNGTLATPTITNPTITSGGADVVGAALGALQSSTLGQPNGPVRADASGLVPLAVLPAATAVPPAATAQMPSLFADFANRIYAAAVSGRLYPQSMEALAWVSGPQSGGYYIDPSSRGHQSIPGGARFGFNTVQGKRVGVFVEPAVATNYVTCAQTFSTTGGCWAAGADGQASVTTQIAPLFDGWSTIVMLRDSSTNDAGGDFTVTIPNSIFAYEIGQWVYIPSRPVGTFTTQPYPSPASSICLSVGGTSVGHPNYCADLNKKDVWQLIQGPLATASGTSITLQLFMAGPPGTIAFSTAPFVVPVSEPATVTVPAGRTQDSLVGSGLGLEQIGTGSGTLLFRGFGVGAQVTAVPSGGIQASDTTGANSVALQVLGDPANPSLQAVVTGAGATVATLPGGALQPGQPFTMALSWGPSGYVYADSLGGAGTATGAIPTGLSGLTALPGPNPISQIAFYPTAMPAAALQSLVGNGLSVTASANASTPGLTVPNDFLGLSFELNGSLNNNQFSMSTASGPSLTALANTAKIHSFRLGGDSSENNVNVIITAADVSQITPFMAAVNNGELIVGLNNCANNPTAQAAGAQLLYTAIPTVTFQWGNEPDLYTAGTSTNCPGIAPAANSYGPSSYITSWNAGLAAIRALMPTANMAGPDVGSLDSWLQPFMLAEASNLTLLTRHYYALCPNAGATVPNLLMTDTSYPAITLPQEVALAATGGLKLRMTETNSICAGGSLPPTTPPISNALVAATWAVEYMMQGIQAGLAGVNFHGVSINGTPGGTYDPILQASDKTWTLAPVGYAMLTIGQIEGMQVLPVTSSVPFTTTPVGAYLDSGSNVWFLAVNKNLNLPAQLTITQGGTWTQQSVLTMTGSSPASTTVTLGGATMDNEGHWTPTPALVARGTPVSIPPASAILVKLQ
jgi:hypothetical protein